MLDQQVILTKTCPPKSQKVSSRLGSGILLFRVVRPAEVKGLALGVRQALRACKPWQLCGAAKVLRSHNAVPSEPNSP